jgi:Cysteine protease
MRDQNPFGTCWAFSSLASLESTFLKAGKGAFDFSEWHLAYFAYVDEDPSLPAFTATAPGFGSDPIFDQGGSVFQAAALLARWTGAVAESTRPYQNTSPWPESSRPRASDRAAKRLENVFLIQGEGLLDEEAVKYALMRWGAVSVRVVWDDGAYSEDHASFYNAPESGGGHIVTVVGWDDDFSGGEFRCRSRPRRGMDRSEQLGYRLGRRGVFLSFLRRADPGLSGGLSRRRRHCIRQDLPVRPPRMGE